MFEQQEALVNLVTIAYPILDGIFNLSMGREGGSLAFTYLINGIMCVVSHYPRKYPHFFVIRLLVV
jgi:hypothetical protein